MNMSRLIAPAIAIAIAACPLASQAEVDAAALWSSRCANCHGDDGKAQTTMGRKHKIADLSSPARQKRSTDDDLRDVIENGVPDTRVKAYKDRLSAAEITALIKYIRALPK